MGTFVTVGNAKQPFSRLLDIVSELYEQLPKPVTVQSGNTPFKCNKCNVVDFMSREEYEQCIISSDLIIMHAGAGSVLTAIRYGKRPIIMARMKKYDEHVNDHQLEFAKKVQKIGLPVSVVSDAEDLAIAVSKTNDEDKFVYRLKNDCRLLHLVKKELENIASGKG